MGEGLRGPLEVGEECFRPRLIEAPVLIDHRVSTAGIRYLPLSNGHNRAHDMVSNAKATMSACQYPEVALGSCRCKAIQSARPTKGATPFM